MTTNTSYIATSLKRIRKERQYSQKQLAELMGVKGSTISNIEKEVHGATIDFLIKFCQVTHSSLDEITGISQNNEEIQIDSTLLEIIEALKKSENPFVDKRIVNRLIEELERKGKDIERLEADLERTNKLLNKLIP